LFFEMIAGAVAPGNIGRTVRLAWGGVVEEICKIPLGGRQCGISILQTDHREGGFRDCRYKNPALPQPGAAGLHAKAVMR
ncbi:MAG: hypothetical protein LBI91_08660, partial [Spirochaetaceae bacterium]|jgi:hypothetical protein|nr:hypothetical protein [Spirochaetaceae bacterium]